MAKVKVIVCLAALALSMQIVHSEMMEGKYRIENVADGLHITSEGGNSPFARIVAENWQNFGEQKWSIEKSALKTKVANQGYFLSPDKYKTNNAFSYFVDPAQKYPIPQRWTLLPVRGGYQIQNQRTGLCLISSGRRREVLEGKCDQYLRDRHWAFHSV